MTDILIGRDREGRKVYVSPRLERQQGRRETVEHEHVDNPLELGIQGAVIRFRGSYDRDGDWEGAGQISTDHLRSIASHGGRPEPGWTPQELRRLADIWDEWHLNAMQAGCAHQEVVWEDGKYGRQPSLELTPPCPHTGYRYGHSWLVRPLPDDVIEFITNKFGIEVPA